MTCGVGRWIWTGFHVKEVYHRFATGRLALFVFVCLSGSHLFGSNNPLLWYQLMNVYRASCIHSRGLLNRAGKRSTSSSADKFRSVVFFCSLALFLIPGTWDRHQSDEAARWKLRQRWEPAGLRWCINSSMVIVIPCGDTVEICLLDFFCFVLFFLHSIRKKTDVGSRTSVLWRFSTSVRRKSHLIPHLIWV